jgi:hypothetical protein
MFGVFGKKAQQAAYGMVAASLPATPATGMQEQHVRGTQVIDCTPQNMRDWLWSQKLPDQIQIGHVPIDPQDEWQHFLLAGGPGTGKSLTLKWMLETIRRRDEKALVYDPVGDLVAQFYRPGVDVILSPLDERDAGWYPWADLERHELPAFAQAIVPDPAGQQDPFWAKSAQAVLQALMLGTRSVDDLLRYGIYESDETLMALVRKMGKHGLVGQEKTFSGVRAQLSVGLEKLGLLHNITPEQHKEGRGFSLKKWTESDYDRRWVFLLSRKNQQEALKPLITLWTDTVVRAALSLTPSPARRIWLSLDELPSLGKLPSLSPAMAEGRKYGLSAILGLQTVQQLRQTYGREEAAVIYGLPRNRLILRIHDAETCDEMSRELGEYQRKRITISSSHGSSWGTSQGDSYSDSSGGSSNVSAQEQLVIERAVMPSEISALPNLYGYLQTSNRVSKVAVPIPARPFVESQPPHISRPQRALPWE